MTHATEHFKKLLWLVPPSAPATKIYRGLSYRTILNRNVTDVEFCRDGFRVVTDPTLYLGTVQIFCPSFVSSL